MPFPIGISVKSQERLRSPSENLESFLLARAETAVILAERRLGAFTCKRIRPSNGVAGDWVAAATVRKLRACPIDGPVTGAAAK
jgi:hypothetical protein